METAENIHNDVRLIDLIDGLTDCRDRQHRCLQSTVHGIQSDSRRLQQGDLFIACFGRNHDARDFIPEALQSGISAVLAESGPGWQGMQLSGGIPVIAVDNLAAKTSEIAARFYQRPTDSMTVIGVTGTNGKTTCSQLLAQLLTALGFRCGVMGTLGYGLMGATRETSLTTPDAIFTQRALAEMQGQQAEPVVMEVSSIGLHQQRIAAVAFGTAIFTNLTRDHLDYHESMAAYAETKRALFTTPGLSNAVINLDDPHAPTMMNAISNDVTILTYSMHNPAATVHVESCEFVPGGCTATISTPIGRGTVHSQLLGRFNFSNLLAVAAASLAYLPRHGNLCIDDLCRQLSRLKPVIGRMEIVGENRDITVVVDYAHTPDGLRSALSALRQHFAGEIWCVFGCGGNRDQGKRPLMGEVAQSHADHLLLTDDNPRNEQGDEIIKHILSGTDNPDAVQVERDRANAIALAISQARSGDVVLIAGKGHETYQERDGVRIPFSDVKQARLAMKVRDT